MAMLVEPTEHDEQVLLAEELFEQSDFRGAIGETRKVLDQLEVHIPTIAQAAVVHGRALMTQTIQNVMNTFERPSKKTLDKIFHVAELSDMLQPGDKETQFLLAKVSRMLKKMPLPEPPKQIKEANPDYDVLVVGAGAAGVGTALMLTETFGLEHRRVVLMERGARVGESFRRWPAEMKFISPSFNQQGWTKTFDLNSISSGTSPAFSLHTEHPSGMDYATYLEAMAKKHKLNIMTDTEVVEIRDISFVDEEQDEPPLCEWVESDEEGQLDNSEQEEEEDKEQKLPFFSVDIQALPTRVTKTVTARFIVWAAGEFQYPKGATASYAKKKSSETATELYRDGSPISEEKKDLEEKDTREIQHDYDEGVSEHEFPGAELCMHNSMVKSWATLSGNEYVVIGGYESGVDAAVNLSKAGKQCKVLASTPCWSVKTADPSTELAPFTAARLRDVLAPGFSPQPQLMAPLRVVKVEKEEESDTESTRFGFRITAEWEEEEEADDKPNMRNLVNHSDATEPCGEVGSTFVIHTPNPPILCTGFEGSVAAAASHLFDLANDSNSKGCLYGAPLLTLNDESTKVPGVFLVGPTVSHGPHSFCFVYKFRQRFAIVADAICQRLGKDTRGAVRECREANMFLDDFGCCEDTCGDVC